MDLFSISAVCLVFFICCIQNSVRTDKVDAVLPLMFPLKLVSFCSSRLYVIHIFSCLSDISLCKAVHSFPFKSYMFIHQSTSYIDFVSFSNLWVTNLYIFHSDGQNVSNDCSQNNIEGFTNQLHNPKAPVELNY